MKDLKLKIEYWPIEKLLPYARNPRKNDDAVDKGASFIKEFGFSVPVLVQSDGTIIDGHLRLKCAKRLDMKEVPVCVRDDMTSTQIKAFRLSVNRFSELADWDDDLLKIELEELDNLQYDISLLDMDDKIQQEDKPNVDRDIIEAEIKFSEYIGESNNYIVLIFKNDIDWLQATSHFKLERKTGSKTAKNNQSELVEL